MTLLRTMGFSRAACNAQAMDIPQPTQRWMDLFTQLGVEPQWASDALSTYPYWRCLTPRRLGAPSTLGQSRLLDLRRSHPRHWLQLCPSCVAHDLQHLGIPYLRRAHQLPASIVCHEHGDRLISHCGACNAILRPAVRRRSFDLDSLGARCACGWDFRAGIDQPRPSQAWQKLAIFEKECLSLPSGSFAGEPPRLALAHALGAHGPPKQLLLRAFGTDQEFFAPWRIRKLLAGSKATASAMRYLTPPILCAMFTAGGFDAQGALELVTTMVPSTKPFVPRKTRGTLLQPTSLEEAKDCFHKLRVQGYAQTWALFRRQDRFVFWFLVLEGQEWLIEQLGPPPWLLNIPSIEQDREVLQSSATGIRFRQEASARAHCRDRAWLAHLGQSDDTTLSADHAAQIHTVLSAKKLATAPSTTRPQKFTSRHAATALGKSLAHVNWLRAHLPPDSDSLYESPAAFQWRVLIWAVSGRVKRGESLSGNFVSKDAGLVNTPLTRFMACTVIALFACDEQNRPLAPLTRKEAREIPRRGRVNL